MIQRGSLDLLGPSTKAALERVRAGEDPLTVGGLGTTNGAAMRVTPDRYRGVNRGFGSVRGRRLVLLPGDTCDTPGFPVGCPRGGGGIACS